jgi:hypothetical protein
MSVNVHSFLPDSLRAVTADAIFERRGDAFFATELARGPWDPGAQHGGAPASLLAGEMERLPGGDELQIARITYELMRPVPLGQLQTRAEVVRPGKRVQLLEAELSLPDGTPLVRARAVRVARAPVSAGAAPEPPPIPPHTLAPASALRWRPDSLPGGAVEIRFTDGTPADAGPHTAWFRLKVPVVAGEEPTPLQRLTVAADFPNGISSELPWGKWLYINPDLTVYVEREPRSEWVALQAQTRIVEGAAAVAQAVLFDTDGRIGRSLQSLYVAPATSAETP